VGHNEAFSVHIIVLEKALHTEECLMLYFLNQLLSPTGKKEADAISPRFRLFAFQKGEQQNNWLGKVKIT
jgi:hypothetical protein